MPASRDTKKLLADTLRSMMETTPFDQITVTRLCEACGINRKSFYYHFKDKYDVINWIFDSELEQNITDDPSVPGWANLVCFCNYFYKNRTFYKKALEIRGQNSFTQHFRDTLFQRFQSTFSTIASPDKVSDFQINFFTDATVMAFHRWLRSKDCMTPEAFLEQLSQSTKTTQSVQIEELK